MVNPIDVKRNYKKNTNKKEMGFLSQLHQSVLQCRIGKLRRHAAAAAGVKISFGRYVLQLFRRARDLEFHRRRRRRRRQVREGWNWWWLERSSHQCCPPRVLLNVIMTRIRFKTFLAPAKFPTRNPRSPV